MFCVHALTLTSSLIKQALKQAETYLDAFNAADGNIQEQLQQAQVRKKGDHLVQCSDLPTCYLLCFNWSQTSKGCKLRSYKRIITINCWNKTLYSGEIHRFLRVLTVGVSRLWFFCPSLHRVFRQSPHVDEMHPYFTCSPSICTN